MSLVSQGFNNSPTQRETERIHYFIKTKEAEREFVQNELLNHLKQLKTCDDAIFNLELTVPDAKQILQANENSLVALLNIQTQLNLVRRIQEKKLRNEPVTKTLYSEFLSCSKQPLARLSEHIDEQISALKSDVRSLWDKVRELEMELGSWNSSKRLFQRAIKRLNASHWDIEEDIKLAGDAFRSIWNVPSDVWVKIFQYTIEEERVNYLSGNRCNRGMRPPLFKLSQVCQRWRYLVNNEPSLWTLVYVAPTSIWRQDENDLVVASIQKANAPLIVLTNLSQDFIGGYYTDVRYNNDGEEASVVSPDESILFRGKKYTLVVSMNDDENEYMERPTYLPLSQPAALIFSARGSIRYGNIFQHFESLYTVKSFSLINDYPSAFDSGSLASHLPKLEKFTFHVKKFPSSFQLAKLLPNTLHELYLRNDEGGTLPTVSHVELPHLRVLGITFPGSYLLDKLTAKRVKLLTFYGPHDNSGRHISTSNKAVKLYKQFSNLNFEDWKTSSTPDRSFGAVSVLGGLQTRTPSLHTISFSKSYINGADLVAMMNTIVAGSDGPTTLNKPEVMILSYPSGITNDQCEELKQLMKHVKIYT
ncbi:hypothetical protein CPB86DRAFT_878721 [Serendipita vermifera]|nr:hypothetical protein CPB86DRAFT_878721 [Serendipita vermifera]